MEAYADIGKILAALVRQRVVILALTFVCALGALGMHLSRPTLYAAKTILLVHPQAGLRSRTDAKVSGHEVPPQLSLSSQGSILESGVIGQRVRDRLGGPESTVELANNVRVRVLTQELLEIEAAFRTPERAALIAATFAQEYMTYRLESTERGRDLAKSGLARHVAALDRELESPTGPNAIERRGALLRARRLLRSIEVTRDNKPESMSAGAELLGVPDVQRERLGGGPMRAAGVGGSLGLVLGIFLAFARDLPAMRTSGALHHLSGVPIVGELSGRRRGLTRWAWKEWSPYARDASEGYRAMRQKLVAMGLARTIRTVVTTAASVEANSAEVSLRLAEVCAGAGMRVIAVDGRVAAPKLHLAAGIENDIGLADVLEKRASTADALRTSSVTNLRLLTAGSAAGNTHSVIDSRGLREVVAELRQQADLVVIDAPSTDSGADVRVLASNADLALVAVPESTSGMRSGIESAARLQSETSCAIVRTRPSM